MMMNKDNGKKTGSSEARKRQGGGTVPAPPRSCQEGKSCDGLSDSLSASESEAWAIAKGRGVVEGRKKRDEDQDQGPEKEREERKKKGHKTFRFEELTPEIRVKAEEGVEVLEKIYEGKSSLFVYETMEELIGRII